MRADTPYDVAEHEDNAGRFASVALTSSLAATALHKMAADPTAPLSGRYRQALTDMADTIDLLNELSDSGRLEALIDRSLGVVDALEPVQLVARLASEPETATGDNETNALDTLLRVRDKLKSVLRDPEPGIAAELVPIFRTISRGAMLSAQKVEESATVDDGYMRLAAVYG